mmetsp:Transcript_21895/g.45827  ORF Transcript_21895/g.45827 Transcript_21895/m.45827 type:complete len:212 (-) Transcript_21895:130-765(-)
MLLRLSNLIEILRGNWNFIRRTGSFQGCFPLFLLISKLVEVLSGHRDLNSWTGGFQLSLPAFLLHFDLLEVKSGGGHFVDSLRFKLCHPGFLRVLNLLEMNCGQRDFVNSLSFEYSFLSFFLIFDRVEIFSGVGNRLLGFPLGKFRSFSRFLLLSKLVEVLRSNRHLIGLSRQMTHCVFRRFDAGYLSRCGMRTIYGRHCLRAGCRFISDI